MLLRELRSQATIGVCVALVYPAQHGSSERIRFTLTLADQGLDARLSAPGKSHAHEHTHGRAHQLKQLHAPSLHRPSLPPSLNYTGPEQVRDEVRATNDPARGGLGGVALAEENGQLAPQGGGAADYYGAGGGGGGDYYGGGGGHANKRPRVDWDARDRR